MKRVKGEKKKIVLHIIIAVLLIAIVAVSVKICTEKRAQGAREQELDNAYARFWCAVPNDDEIRRDYYDYGVVDEKELYLIIRAYNYYENKNLTLDDIKNYLSDEYNEDGSLRIESGYDEIKEYVDWACSHGRNIEAVEYDNLLQYLYQDIHQELGTDILFEELSLQQLEDLANRVEDPNYKIDISHWK